MATMLTLDKLKAIHPNDLAVLCGNVADDSRMDDDMRTRAFELVMAWTTIQQREPAPASERDQLDQEKIALAAEMVEFLITV
jgi:hypothetical protein